MNLCAAVRNNCPKKNIYSTTPYIWQISLILMGLFEENNWEREEEERRGRKDNGQGSTFNGQKD